MIFVDLVYDKYNGDHKGNGNHCYDNEMTKNIPLDTLNDGSFNYYESKDAVEYYNNKFNANFSLPNYLYKSPLFKLKVYFKEHDGLLIIFVIVSLNVQLLEKYYIQSNIPYMEFINVLFMYHSAYEKQSKFLEIEDTNYAKEMNNFEYIKTKASESVSYIYQDSIENPKELNIELYKYQKCSVHWMLRKELNKSTLFYSLCNEIMLGNLYYDCCFQRLELTNKRKSLTFHGGCLIDEVGLGKTIQIISLILCNRSKNTSYIDPKYAKLQSSATLVICPNHLCGQWIRECRDRIHKKHNLKLVSVRTKPEYDKITYLDILEADIVLVSFNFLDNIVYKSQQLTQLWGKEKNNFNRMHWENYELGTVKNGLSNLIENISKDPFNYLFKKYPILQAVHWHRVVIDEYHEIYKNGIIRHVDNFVKFITANYKWVVTATPFVSIQTITSTINYLTNYDENSYDHKIYTIDKVVDYLSFNNFRRNTKDSVKDEYTLPNITEEINWIKFTHTESLMYNAHITNKFNDKCGIYLRKLCCHPQLADETKSVLANCKTLNDVEKNIVKFYNIEVEKAQKSVDKIEFLIKKTKLKIKFVRYKVLLKEAKKRGIVKNENNDESDDEDYGANIVVNEDDDITLKEWDSLSDDSCNVVSEEHEIDESILDVLECMKDKAVILSNSMTLQSLNSRLNDLNTKHSNAVKFMEGKRSTANFFNNVLEKIKKIIERDTEEDDTSDEENVEKCGICLYSISEDEIGVTICGHLFCYKCLLETAKIIGKCPYCTKKISKDDIYSIAYQKKDKKVTSENKTKNDLINNVGSKLANIITYLKENNKHTIIFSQWDDLLVRIGRILQLNGIPNSFCKGSCYQRDKAIRDFNSDGKVNVIMLSSESSASGTNLTKAEQVIFIEPIYGTYEFRRGQERQAIGRAHRLGQKNNIKIVRFLIKNTIEEDIHNANVEENKKHPGIFSETVEKNIK